MHLSLCLQKEKKSDYLVSCTVLGMCFSDIVWYLIKINIERRDSP